MKIKTLSLLVLVLLISYSVRAKKNEAPKEKIFRISQAVDVETVDPAIARTVEDGNVIEQIFEGLTAYDPKDASPIPAAAEKWELSKDLKTYTFHLRKNAKWSDGSELTADDFVYAWLRILTPKTASPWSYQLFNIKNAKEFYEGKIKDSGKVGLKALDKNTLRIELLKPQPYFLGLLSHSSMVPVKKDVIEKYKRMWTNPVNIVSNGAFILTYREPKDKVVLKKNEKYWDEEHVFLNKVHFYGIENESTGLRMYETGLLDVDGGGLPPEKLDKLKKGKDIVINNYLGTYFYRFNTKKKPFDNPGVRRAFNLAIDKSVITDKILKGGRKPATGLVPPGIGWYDPPNGDFFNVKKARMVLDSEGYCVRGMLNAACRPFPEVEIQFNTLGNHKKIAQAIQAMLKNNLGVEAKTINMDYKTLQANAKNGNFMIVRGGWIGDYVDPATFVTMFAAYSGNNMTGWNNSEFERILVKAEKTVDLKKRAKLFREAEDILNKEVPIIPIYYFARIYLKKRYVKGYYPNILDKHPLKYVKY